jgi:uncharacterized protein (TIGR03118 family)
MKTFMKRDALVISIPGLLIFLTLFFLTSGCRKDDIKKLKNFDQVNLVANNDEYGAPTIEPLLVNGWGLAWAPSGIAWVNSEGGHVSALFNGEGLAPRIPVNIPGPGGPASGHPTGIVFNGTADFMLSNGSAARFLFVGVDGALSGWNQGAGDNAILIKDNSATSAYTGLAIGVSNGANFIYAADFRAGKIAVWDKNFDPVDNMPFSDGSIPDGYAPFNIQAVGDWLYVTYAKVADDGEEEAGVGKGFVSIFNTDGSFVRRFASSDLLNAPWGVTMADKSFFKDGDDNPGDTEDGDYGKNEHHDANRILIGNFGDGKINVYTTDGAFVGQLLSHGHPIVIEGLWAIGFAPVTSTIDQRRLYFTAGPEDEEDGLFGYLIKK